MAFFKTHWFASANILFALIVYGFYFFFVSDVGATNKQLEEEIERYGRVLGTEKFKKPTEAWYAKIGEGQNDLHGQFQKIKNDFNNADKRIEKFFSIQGDTLVDEIPDDADWPLFKEVLKDKWDEMIGKYAYAEKKNIEVEEKSEDDVVEEVEVEKKLTTVGQLRKLEPSWLRNDQTPSESSEVSKAQREFWIVKGICETLEKAGVERMVSIGGFKKTFTDPVFEYKKKPFWEYRNLTVEVQIVDNKVSDLLAAFFKENMLFTVVGLTQKNLSHLGAPAGVEGVPEFVSFAEDKLVNVTISFRHFNYLKEGDEVAAGAAQAVNRSGSGSNSRDRRRR